MRLAVWTDEYYLWPGRRVFSGGEYFGFRAPLSLYYVLVLRLRMYSLVTCLSSDVYAGRGWLHMVSPHLSVLLKRS